MRIAFVADLHIDNHRRFGGPVEAGLNTRAKLCLASLEAAVTRAVHRGCSMFIVLGDLFDTAKPLPQILAATAEKLRKLGPKRAALLCGNHDQVSATPGDNALGPLVDVATLYDRPAYLPITNGSVTVELVLVPFHPGPASEWLPAQLAAMQLPKQPSAHRLLALHLGIYTDATPDYLRDCHDAVPLSLLERLKAEYGLAGVIAGNWHKHVSWGSIVQCGSLIPTGFDNPGLTGYGTLAIWDTAVSAWAWEFEEIPGPRFVQSRSTLPDVPAGCRAFVSITASPTDIPALVEQLHQKIAKGLYSDGEILPDTGLATAAAKTAAAAARASSTLEEAVANYVADMPLDPSVDRSAVTAKVKAYLLA